MSKLDAVISELDRSAERFEKIAKNPCEIGGLAVAAYCKERAAEYRTSSRILEAGAKVDKAEALAVVATSHYSMLDGPGQKLYDYIIALPDEEKK